jgi:ADP-ribose pyrophosphatase
MRKKHSRNVLLLLLSVLMVCGCFYGCNSDKNTETETGESSENVGTETTETPYVLPTADLGAEEMVILSPYGKIWQFDSTWHYNSDELNAGLFKRDKKVEDVLNCTIQMEYVEGSNIAEQFTTKLEAEMLAQTGAYDVVYAETANGLDFKGYFNNLLDSDLSAVLALDENNNVLTVTQYRYVFAKPMLELPAGKLDGGEEPRIGALRELKEETGAVPDTLESLGHIVLSPGCFGETLHLFLARGLHMGQQHLDEGEFLNIEKISLDELHKMAMDGTIIDAKTLVAVLKAKQYLEAVK